MKGKSLLMVAGGMLALGWSGTAMASAVTTSVDFTNIHFNTTGTVTVQFLPVDPAHPGAMSSITTSSFAGAYDIDNNQLTDLGQDGGTQVYTGASASSVPGITGASASVGGGITNIHAHALTPTPVYQPGFAYTFAFSMGDVWQKVRINGGAQGGTVSASGDYVFHLNDMVTNPEAHEMGDVGTGYVGLDVMLIGGLQTDRFKTFKYSIDEFGQYNASGTISTDAWSVMANQSKLYTFNADASAEGADPHATPEPATMLLLGSGLAGLIGMRRKKD